MKKTRTNLKRGNAGDSFWGFLGLLALVLLSAHCSLSALYELRAPEAPLHQVRHPLSPSALEEGRVRLSGVVVVPQGPPELCLVAQKRKSGKTSYTVWSDTIPKDARLRVDDKEYQLDTSNARWLPQNLEDSTSQHETIWRSLHLASPGGWFEDLCVRDSEPLFVEGCLVDGVITACPQQQLLITPGAGTIQPRIDELASGSLLEVSLLWLAGFLLLLGLAGHWRRLPIIKNIAQWSQPSPPADRFEFWLGVAVGGYLLAVLLHWLLGFDRYYFLNYYAAGVFVSALILLVGLFGFFELRLQRREAKTALRLVSLANLAPLGQLQSKGQLVALEVRVKPDAPLSEAPLTKSKYSWWRVLFEEYFEADKKAQINSKTISAKQPRVPIIDGSGEGILDMSGASVFLNAYYRKAHSKKLKGLSSLPMFQPDARVFLEESYLCPSEPLFILGEVSRLSANDSDEALYRKTANIPTIGGSELIVCAGSRAQVASMLRRRFLVLESFMVVTGVLCASLLGLMVWFVSL